MRESPAHARALSTVFATRASGDLSVLDGFERRRIQGLRPRSESAFAQALLADVPPAPARRADIVAANRSGRLRLSA